MALQGLLECKEIRPALDALVGRDHQRRGAEESSNMPDST